MTGDDDGGKAARLGPELMQQLGLTIVALGDKSGGIYNPKGFDVRQLQQHMRKKRFLSEYKEADQITNEQLLTVDCDVLVPAALENVITSKNARDVKARIICEGANGPTTANADKILEEKGVFVIPDILANAGGVTVSYFEWVQDLGRLFWDREEIRRKLADKMSTAFDRVYSVSEEKGLTLRQAAMVAAIREVAAALEARGIYP